MDEKFKVGAYVWVVAQDDEDLDEFLSENGREVIIEEIEDDYFWGRTVSGKQIPYHMEARDITEYVECKEIEQTVSDLIYLLQRVQNRYGGNVPVKLNLANDDIINIKSICIDNGYANEEEIDKGIVNNDENEVEVFLEVNLEDRTYGDLPRIKVYTQGREI